MPIDTAGVLVSVAMSPAIAKSSARVAAPDTPATTPRMEKIPGADHAATPIEIAATRPTCAVPAFADGPGSAFSARPDELVSGTDGPLDRRRRHASTAGCTAVVRESDPSDENPARVAVGEERWLDVGQHQLRAAEHLEGTGLGEVAPREIQKALATLSVDRRSANVEIGVSVGGDHDLDVPAWVLTVARYCAEGLAAFLDGDVHVGKRSTLGRCRTSGPEACDRRYGASRFRSLALAAEIATPAPVIGSGCC
jgi:hypothetical protein